MPISPITGFLVITHLFINIVVAGYELLLGLVHKIKGERPVHTFMHWWFKKEHDTMFRRFVAYGLSTLTLGLILGTSGLYLWMSAGFKIAFLDKTTVASVILAPELSAETMAVHSESTLSTIDHYAFKDALDTFPDSIVDLLKAASMNEASIDYRANIAFELGVVADPAEYRGTYEQNMKLRELLQEEVSWEVLTTNSAGE